MNNTPLCENKLNGGYDCLMCGMTHAFDSIGSFDFESASEYNKASIPLFSLFAFNSAVFLIQSFRKIFKKKGNKL